MKVEKDDSRLGELVSTVREPADLLVTKLSPLGRLQYWLFRKGESVGQSHWTSDLRFVLVASLLAIVLIVAGIALVGGTGVFGGSEVPTGPTPPNMQTPLPPAATK